MKPYQLLLIALLASTVLFSCKKDNGGTADEDARYITHSDDEQLSLQAVDDVMDESLDAVEDEPLLAGKSASTGPCNATKTFDSANRKITIIYSGNNCANTFSRFGKIIITLSPTKKWKDAGAVLSIQTDSLKVTRLSTGKSVVVNGQHTITNTSGGKPFYVKVPAYGMQQVVYTVASTMQVRFDDGSFRAWNAARKRTYTADSNNKLVISVSGNKTLGSQTNVSVWGVNRNGDDFVTVLAEPRVIKESCAFRITAGKVVHSINNWIISTTFGLDASGKAVECPAGDFYMQIQITRPNGTVWTTLKPY